MDNSQDNPNKQLEKEIDELFKLLEKRKKQHRILKILNIINAIACFSFGFIYLVDILDKNIRTPHFLGTYLITNMLFMLGGIIYRKLLFFGIINQIAILTFCIIRYFWI